MLIKFKLDKIDKDFSYLKNENGEELKLKTESLSKNLKIGEEVKLVLFENEDYKQEHLAKEIINEIINTSDNNKE